MTAKQVRDMCWEVLPRATYLISRYQTFEHLYADDSDLGKGKHLLQQVLGELYTLILQYQTTMVIYLHSRVERFKTSFRQAADSKLGSVWKDVRDKESQLAGLQSLADREITNPNFQKVLQGIGSLDETTDKTWDEVQDISRIVKESQRDAVLDWVSNILYEGPHASPQKTAMAGTGQWLLKHSSYIGWRDSDVSTSFWLNGLMGSGKSCLCHVVIEDLKENINSRSGQQLAYFYINGAEARTHRTLPGDYTTTMLRCLLKQLADLGSREKLYEGVVQAYEQLIGRRHLSKDESVSLISRFVKDFQETTIVIDGLDECTEESQAELIECLYNLLETSKALMSVLKVFIASRPE